MERKKRTIRIIFQMRHPEKNYVGRRATVKLSVYAWKHLLPGIFVL